MSIVSSFRNKYIDQHTIAFGEVGLSGEIRAIGMPEKRIIEASKLGFKKCIIPMANKIKLSKYDGIEVIGVDNVSEALNYIN
ncbi:MAG: hypothetical protein ATN32_04920 [Candidatus Epulonipiscium fishelsonii]|nr:MAG: hypothetical protein ATN32_04920 [Epulopiscium sp. AS2M-Bin002]